MALKRIRMELEELKQYIKTENPPFTMGPRDGDADAGNEFCWTGVLMGPERRPYEGGVFFVRILFPVDYPFKPPVFRFETKILHPFVLAEGRVVLEMLQHSWNPAYTVKDVLHVRHSFASFAPVFSRFGGQSTPVSVNFGEFAISHQFCRYSTRF